jgi:hypothetical protein
MDPAPGSCGAAAAAAAAGVAAAACRPVSLTLLLLPPLLPLLLPELPPAWPALLCRCMCGHTVPLWLLAVAEDTGQQLSSSLKTPETTCES